MIAALLPLLLAGQVAAAPVALRAHPPAITQAQARGMAPAALGDALLAPGHPPIVEHTMLPEGFGPPPPPGTVPRLDVRLAAAAEEDLASGFCVKRSWTVSDANDPDHRTIDPETRYRLPSPAARADRCAGPVHAFFTVAAKDRPRAFTVVRLLAAAIRDARRLHAVLSVDDQLGRQMHDFERDHPPRSHPIGIITDARAALAGLPPDAIFGVAPADAPDDLLTRADRRAAGGGHRETWAFSMGGEWWVQLALDGGRIVVIRLRRAIPPPF